MRAVQIIQRQFQLDLLGVHLARIRLVFTAALTALRSSQLSLTALGRAIAERTTHKHGIKRVDRLLGNEKLHQERVVFYRAIARRVVSPGSKPLVIIDWTAVTPKLWALVAAVPFQGRALTILAETHPISRYLKPYVNGGFLRRLKAVLPPSCTPIIVADAGFRAPFMKLVEKMRWEYVVRLRGPALIRHKYGRGWTKLSFLFGLTTVHPKDLGRVEIGQRVRFVTRLVGVRRPIRHRDYRTRVTHSVATWREKRSAHEPWILATSLAASGERVVTFYARRMQIEETFRDAKSPRFGMALGHARPRHEHRADLLLLLASIAHLLAMLLGMAAEAAQLHRSFQANTVTSKRVLSLVTLGRLLAASPNDSLLRSAFGEDGWRLLHVRLDAALAL